MMFRSITIGILILVAFVSSMGSAAETIPVIDVSSAVSATNKLSQRSRVAIEKSRQILYQLELLQQEVQQLRGLVELQEYQLKQMTEKQRGRYVDLDRRMLLLSQQATQSIAAPSKSITTQPYAIGAPQIPDIAPVTVGVVEAFDAEKEKKTYQTAFALVRNKKYPSAIIAFEQMLDNYPDGNYTANAYYWLGEVEFVETDYEQALVAFDLLLRKYPNHRKVPAAKYKQAKIYLHFGDKTRAKQLYQGLIDQYPSSSVAKLAEIGIREAQF